jgi:hypothetical protein
MHNLQMMTHILRVFTDTLDAGAAFAPLPALNRVLYVVSGNAIVRAGGHAASLDPNSTWYGADALAITAGKSGARLLRWELVRKVAPPAGGATLQHDITLDPAVEYLMRCDRVDFPPGGEALTHVHQGPGIRCLLAGGIRIDSEGASHSYGPGEAWFEAGPDPVYAAASRETPTGFARVMILPRTCHGKSSIRYARPEDADKPKSQKYQIFADEFIDA